MIQTGGGIGVHTSLRNLDWRRVLVGGTDIDTKGAGIRQQNKSGIGLLRHFIHNTVPVLGRSVAVSADLATETGATCFRKGWGTVLTAE